MPSTRFSEEALQRRREKLQHAAEFPGRCTPEEAEGKTLARVVPAGEGHVLLFTDGTFLVTQPGPAAGESLLRLLEEIREAVEPAQPEAYAELDRRLHAEREAMRLARMEKVLGAVEHNLVHIPELREELRKLLDF